MSLNNNKIMLERLKISDSFLMANTCQRKKGCTVVFL